MNFVVALRHNEVNICGFYSVLHICAIKRSVCCACIICELVLVLSLKPIEMSWKHNSLIMLWGRFLILAPVLSQRRFEAARLAKELGFLYHEKFH